MPQKRKSRGRAKGSAGRKGMVQCSGCGKLVPRDRLVQLKPNVSQY